MNSSKRTKSPDLFLHPLFPPSIFLAKSGKPIKCRLIGMSFHAALFSSLVFLFILHLPEVECISTRQDPFPVFSTVVPGQAGLLALPFALLPGGLKLCQSNCWISILMACNSYQPGKYRNEMLFWGGDNKLERGENLALWYHVAAPETKAVCKSCVRTQTSLTQTTAPTTMVLNNYSNSNKNLSTLLYLLLSGTVLSAFHILTNLIPKQPCKRNTTITFLLPMM